MFKGIIRELKREDAEAVKGILGCVSSDII